MELRRAAAVGGDAVTADRWKQLARTLDREARARNDSGESRDSLASPLRAFRWMIGRLDEHCTIFRERQDDAHEIAHWLLADIKRRQRADFGLGHPGGYMQEPIPGAQLEEERASMLGILLEREHDLRWGFSWNDHGWSGGIGAANTLRDLFGLGLITAAARPRVLRREHAVAAGSAMAEYILRCDDRGWSTAKAVTP